MSAKHQLSRTLAKAAVSALGIAVFLCMENAQAHAGKNQIRALSHHSVSGDASKAIPGTTTLRVAGTTTPTFTVYKLERPARIVIDVANAALAPRIAGVEGKAVWSVNSWSVGQVTAHPIRGAGRSVVRVVVAMPRPSTYKVKAAGSDVVVTVTPRDPAPRTITAASAAKALEEARAEAARAKRVSEMARSEAQRAKVRAEAEARRAAEAEAKARTATRRAGERAKATIADLERQAEATRAEADKAKAKSEQARRELERLRRSQAASKSELAKAQRSARLAKAEAERMRKASTQAATQAEEARKRADNRAVQAERAKRAAQAEAAAAKSEASRARHAARQARKEAERMKREAAEALAAAEKARTKAEAEVAQFRRRAAAEADRAEKAIAEARAEAERVRAAAEQRARHADTRIAEAAALMKTAERELSRVKTLEHEAKVAKKSADKARTRAARREGEAARAEARAKEREMAANQAEAAARKYRRQASQAGDNGRKAEALRRRAERAAKAAERRRAEAETALRAAEKTRRVAERAARAAKQQQEQAERALREARELRTVAEKAKEKAEKQRIETEKLGRLAERRRAEAEQAAREASERAKRARQLRQREEAAYLEITKTRAKAEEKAQEARAAEARLAAAKRAVTNAESRATAMRSAAADAKLRVAALVKRKNASKRELADLRREADRLAKQRQLADQTVRERRAEAAEFKRQVADLDEARRKSVAELRRVKDAASKAREAREHEEKLLAQLVKQRTELEGKLEKAQSKLEQIKRDQAKAEDKSRAIAKAEAEARAKAEAEARAEAEAEARAKAKAKAEAEAQAKATREKAEAQAKAAAKKAAAKKTAAKKAPRKRRHVEVKDLDFVDKQRFARVVIALSGQAKPRVISAKGRRAILEITGAELPAALERTLDTSRYRGPVTAISSYRDRRNPDKMRVVVDLKLPVKSALKRLGSTYYWDFAKQRQGLAKRSAKSEKTGKARSRRLSPLIVGGYGAASTPITQKSVAQLSRRKRKVYRGTKIDLDFKDADIHNLLRLLADVGGVNIVIPDEIKARVTVRLRRVPWDQALEVILASKGLWYRREGNLYRVAPRKQLDAEDEAEAARLANLVKSEAPEPQVFILNYSVAEDLKEQLAPLLSPKGRIEVDKRTNSLIINDIKAHRRRIVDLLTRLDTQTPQVQIEARIVEARSSFSREIGIQWGGNASASQQGGNATGLIFPSSINFAGGAEDNETNREGVATPSDFAVNLPAAVGSGAGGALGVSLGSVGGNFNLNLRLSALEDSGSVRIISAPKITVLNNVKAEISQGVSIPISVISANGVQTQFVPADLSLKVVPHVSQRDCSVQMELDISKNEADFVNTGARGDPSILRKVAKTTVLVADGATTVIGGIYTRNTGLSYSKVPLLGDLPFFGWLFKNRREADERTEVLIFITPKITNKAFLRCE